MEQGFEKGFKPSGPLREEGENIGWNLSVKHMIGIYKIVLLLNGCLSGMFSSNYRA